MSEEGETLRLNDKVEDSVKAAGEGSANDPNVENEVKPKKIFFFGQPGCLKHSPVKAPGSNDNHNNHEASKADTAVSKMDSTDSDDEAKLLRKISEALGEEIDEPDKSRVEEKDEIGLTNTAEGKFGHASEGIVNHAKPTGFSSTATDIKAQYQAATNTQIDSNKTVNVYCATSNSEIKEDSQINCGDSKVNESCSEIESKSAKKSDLLENEIIDQNDSNKSSHQRSEKLPSLIEQPALEVKAELAKESPSKPNLISIVPYDEDSTSSSSQGNAEVTQQESSEASNLTQLDKSASLPGDVTVDLVVDDGAAENLEPCKKQIEEEPIEESQPEEILEVLAQSEPVEGFSVEPPLAHAITAEDIAIPPSEPMAVDTEESLENIESNSLIQPATSQLKSFEYRDETEAASEKDDSESMSIESIDGGIEKEVVSVAQRSLEELKDDQASLPTELSFKLELSEESKPAEEEPEEQTESPNNETIVDVSEEMEVDAEDLDTEKVAEVAEYQPEALEMNLVEEADETTADTNPIEEDATVESEADEEQIEPPSTEAQAVVEVLEAPAAEPIEIKPSENKPQEPTKAIESSKPETTLPVEHQTPPTQAEDDQKAVAISEDIFEHKLENEVVGAIEEEEEKVAMCEVEKSNDDFEEIESEDEFSEILGVADQSTSNDTSAEGAEAPNAAGPTEEAASEEISIDDEPEKEDEFVKRHEASREEIPPPEIEKTSQESSHDQVSPAVVFQSETEIRQPTPEPTSEIEIDEPEQNFTVASSEVMDPTEPSSQPEEVLDREKSEIVATCFIHEPQREEALSDSFETSALAKPIEEPVALPTQESAIEIPSEDEPSEVLEHDANITAEKEVTGPMISQAESTPEVADPSTDEEEEDEEELKSSQDEPPPPQISQADKPDDLKKEILAVPAAASTKDDASDDDYDDYQGNDQASDECDHDDDTEQPAISEAVVQVEPEITNATEVPIDVLSSEDKSSEEPAVVAQEIPIKLQAATTKPVEAEHLTTVEAGSESMDLSSIKSTCVAEPDVAEVKELSEPKPELVKAPKKSDPKPLTKPVGTRKRKISERKSASESDSDGHNVIEAASHDNSSDDEEAVLKKKPRMRGKTTVIRKMLPRRAAAAAAKKVVEEVEKKPEVKAKEPPKVALKKAMKAQEIDAKVDEPEKKSEEAEQTLQNFKFDYDGSEDVAANVAAIRTMICKDPQPKNESESEDDDRRAGNKRTRKTRGRCSKRIDADSSSDDDSTKQSNKIDSKRTKTQDEAKESPSKKKRETGTKGPLKYIDTSLVIDTTENEAPVRMSRRIAQQKIREESDRRQMEEKMLKQMKAEADKKKLGGTASEEEEDEYEQEDQKDSSGVDDESFKESRRKKKSKIKPADKQWQTSSSHSEHSESEEYMEHVPSDPGSPLFKSDHEFSPESDVDDTTQVQPVKRARTAKKLEAVSSSDDDEDINPKHACQVCHKTDSPEWILLCDECDCGYHCSCLKPIIFLIPSGNWFCPLCCHKKLITNLSDQLTQLDTLIYNIETAELRSQRQKLQEITEQNILQERRKNRAEKATAERKSSPTKSSSGSSESDNSSDDEPLMDHFYKLRKRNQTAAPSYRFNEYDDLINSAIRKDMDEVKGAGNLGRGKDISTIIEADKEEKEQQDGEVAAEGEEAPKAEKNEGDESSGSDVVRPKKSVSRKKKKKKLNNLDASSEDERVSDEDFKGTSSSDSEVDEEDLSMSSVSESSLDMPSKKSKGRNVRKSTRNKEKRSDRRFINDGDTDSDDEPLIKAKRAKKKDSDEEEFNDDDDDDEGSLAEEIDSEDLCDDTETDSSSSESNWPRKKKKKRNASYDMKPRKAPKKNENEDKAFRAGISKKKALKKSDNESEGSEKSDGGKGRRKTRGKKLLYLIEDDLDSDESDGIKPGVKRPETPPEEREMFVKKQEEIKRMLAAKDTEAARKLAAPTIQPIQIAIEKPKTPPIPFSNEPASLSTIPKNVIESAKALDTDYNRIKPILGGLGAHGSMQSNDMNEEELAKMMEEEDFAQHQLKLAGEAIARSKKLLEIEAKEEEFAAYSKVNRDKEWPSQPVVDSKKRSRKSKSSEKSNDGFAGFVKAPQAVPPMPPLMNPNIIPHSKPLMMPQQPSIIASLMQQHQPPPYGPPNLINERPSVLSSFMTRPEMHPQHMKIHQPIPPEVFSGKNPLSSQLHSLLGAGPQHPPLTPQQQQQFDEEEKKKGRRKKFTPLRTDLIEGNISKLAKLDQPSVIQSAMNPSGIDRGEDKSKALRPDQPKLAVAAPPQIFNPATTPTPSVITRLLQPQQRPGPYGPGFPEGGPLASGDNPNLRMYPAPDDMKNSPPGKRPVMPPATLPQTSFSEHPFVPRNIHPLYRGPPGYAIPPHARLPPYPFHHLHPNLRPEYSAPYNIPPQFSYYAPPAHSRQQPQASGLPLNHGVPQHPNDISNSIRNANNSEEPSETSEFGGLVSYFSSQQELD